MLEERPLDGARRHETGIAEATTVPNAVLPRAALADDSPRRRHPPRLRHRRDRRRHRGRVRRRVGDGLIRTQWCHGAPGIVATLAPFMDEAPAVAGGEL